MKLMKFKKTIKTIILFLFFYILTMTFGISSVEALNEEVIEKNYHNIYEKYLQDSTIFLRENDWSKFFKNGFPSLEEYKKHIDYKSEYTVVFPFIIFGNIENNWSGRYQLAIWYFIGCKFIRNNIVWIT